ncbi:hypothetical protein [Paraburkholderia acidipaludis]|uniref:hypothetical protein n=1 Tax=Paraburkholderia acidipaludis TaxID=660537 RepID=UPI000489A3F5|nr:hypothetical protein [Paraburkholderia acidipaludis]
MKTYDFDQRIEEIQLALAHEFDSPRRPAVSFLDTGDALVLNITWVIESHPDTTLDKRCAATLRATREQFERYAKHDTAQRREIQQRIGARVRSCFEASRQSQPESNECAIELVLDDEIFNAESDSHYRPTLS